MAQNEIKIQAEGVQSKADMPTLLRAINDDLDTFDPYMEKFGGSKLTSYDRSTLRSYLVWKVLDIKDEDIKTVPN